VPPARLRRAQPERRGIGTVTEAAPALHAALSGFRPEPALEGALLADRRLRAGLAWG
jgi:hypothetical protein